MKQKCQLQMGISQYENVATPLISIGNNTTHQHFQMRYVTLFQLKGLNPISGEVWNDVIRRGWVNLTTSVLGYIKIQKQTHSGHILVPAIYFDVYHAIERKISPK